MAPRGVVRSGDLRHRVSLYRIQKERDTAGAWSERRVAVLSGVPARVTPLGGRELMQARQVDARVTHEVLLRYDPRVAPLLFEDELEHAGRDGSVRVFAILDVIDAEERGVLWVIRAQERR